MASSSRNNWLIWVGGIVSTAILLGSLLDRLPFDLLEVFAIVSGIACVVLAIRENVWNFPLGIISNICLGVLFYRAHLYGVMALQVMFIILGMHGWYKWKCGTDTAPLRISRVRLNEAIVLTLIAIPLIWALTWYLGRVDDPAPFPDALVTVMSLFAQYLLNLKRAENWALGVVIDVINIGIYVSQGLYLTTGLFAFYLVMCAVGYREWLAIYREQIASVLGSEVEEPSDVLPVG